MKEVIVIFGQDRYDENDNRHEKICSLEDPWMVESVRNQSEKIKDHLQKHPGGFVHFVINQDPRPISEESLSACDSQGSNTHKEKGEKNA